MSINITLFYSILHLLVDGICAFAMFAIFLPQREGMLFLILYNFCAFALQMPFGVILDMLQIRLEQRAHLSGELEAYQQETDDVQQWMKLIREYAKLEELDRPTLLRLIKRIEVGEKKVEDGCTVRDIKIHYNFVGYIEV